MPAPKPTPERRRALAEGMARVHAGEPVDTAARSAGVPATTLRRWYARCYAADAEAMANVEAEVIGASLALAHESAAALRERLARPDTSTRELVAVFTATTGAAAKARGWASAGDEGEAGNSALGKALAALAASGGGKVTLTVEADAPPIDVTPADKRHPGRHERVNGSGP